MHGRGVRAPTMKSPPSRCDGIPGLTWLGTTPVPPTPDGRRERRPQSVEYPQLVPKAASRFWVGDQGLLPWVPDSASMPVCWRASVLRVRPATAAASGESGVGLRPAGGTVASRSCGPEVRGRGSRRCPRSRPGGVRPGYRTAGETSQDTRVLGGRVDRTDAQTAGRPVRPVVEWRKRYTGCISST